MSSQCKKNLGPTKMEWYETVQMCWTRTIHKRKSLELTKVSSKPGLKLLLRTPNHQLK